jgi:hypothetical protein
VDTCGTERDFDPHEYDEQIDDDSRSSAGVQFLSIARPLLFAVVSIPGVGYVLAIVFGPAVAVMGVLLLFQIPLFYIARRAGWLPAIEPDPRSIDRSES